MTAVSSDTLPAPIPATPDSGSTPASPDRDRIDTALRVAVIGLVAIVAAIAFVASFEAISQYAVRVGAFPASLWWAAPLLVDTFIVAGSLAALRRARAKQWAVYPWALVAAGTAVSVTLNVAHAPASTPARLVSALPSTALLASFELLLAEARRTGRYESVVQRAWKALARRRRRDPVIRQPEPPRPPRVPVPDPPRTPREPAVPDESKDVTVVAAARPRNEEARRVVRELLLEHGDNLTARQAGDAVGLSRSRGAQLIASEKQALAARNGTTP